MKRTLGILLACSCWAWSLAAPADVLKLKDGTVLNGSYAGGTPGTVRFITLTGAQAVAVSQITALNFTDTYATGAVLPSSAADPSQAVLVPPGTTLLVRTIDTISSQDRSGTAFATRLEHDLRANNTIALKAGTTIHGRIQRPSNARRAVNRPPLDLRLNQIVINGQRVAITTSSYREVAQASSNPPAKEATVGATNGTSAGGTGKGAAADTDTGATVRGQTVTLPPGTLLEFTLTLPVTLQPSAP